MKPRTVWGTVEVRLTYDKLNVVDALADLTGKNRQKVLRTAIRTYLAMVATRAGAGRWAASTSD